MARKLLAAVIAAAALGAVSSAAADQLPILRSAKAVDRHVVLAISVSDTRPTQLVAAKHRAIDLAGALLRQNIRLRETIDVPATADGVIHWESQKTLPPGTYFVQVEAVDTAGVTDCPPKQMPCGEHWSNVRRVVVPG